jgi:hypothetical protein
MGLRVSSSKVVSDILEACLHASILKYLSKNDEKTMTTIKGMGGIAACIF